LIIFFRRDLKSEVTVELISNKRRKRLLEVDKHLILPAHTPVTFLVTSGDVLHSFAMPQLGLKIDTVPGRVNMVHLEGARIGLYYGQCSELCGVGHGFMPIVIEMVKYY